MLNFIYNSDDYILPFDTYNKQDHKNNNNDYS